MKIGIVTTYDEINFGAYLQAYSLEKYVSSMGHNVHLINFKSYEYKKAEFVATYKIRNPLYLLKTIKKSIKFHKSIKDLRVSKKYKTIAQINDENYDAIIYGSDEIWNLNNCLGGVVDPYYFGNEIETKKISYAASFGSTSQINKEYDYIKNSLLSFDFVGLRDKNSEKIMNKIGYKNTQIVLDPTFLINQNVIEPNINKKYIFYYCVGSNEKLDGELLNLSRNLGLDVIAFGYKHNKFKNIISISPFEWLGYLKNSEYVVTNMFHGAIFSIKYKKKFIVKMTKYRENKLGFLLDLLSLRDRVYIENNFECIIQNTIDYSAVFKKINSMVLISKDYLKKALF
jgi:hypothetical protein